MHNPKISIALILCLVALLGAKPATTYTGTVVGITDGDTLTVRTATGTIKVRLEGIDAPEKAQPFGNVSRKHLAKLAHKRQCTITSSGKDRYGRVLGDVYIDGKSINLQMVTDGLAWHYLKYNQEKRFAGAEAKAREKKLGLWRDANPVAPWDWRKMPAKERAAAQSGRGEVASPSTADATLAYWLNTKSNVRHNSSCRWYGATKQGRKCTASDGKACGICGG